MPGESRLVNRAYHKRRPDVDRQLPSSNKARRTATDPKEIFKPGDEQFSSNVDENKEEDGQAGDDEDDGALLLVEADDRIRFFVTVLKGSTNWR